jgi:hypothetical protein
MMFLLTLTIKRSRNGINIMFFDTNDNNDDFMIDTILIIKDQSK